MTSLITGLDGFSLSPDSDEGYYDVVSACADRLDLSFFRSGNKENFEYVEEIFADGEGGVCGLLEEMKQNLISYELSIFKVKQYAAMSSLCCNNPAADRVAAVDLYRQALKRQKILIEKLAELEKESESRIDPCWLSRYIESINLTIREDLSIAEFAFRRMGFLSHT